MMSTDPARLADALHAHVDGAQDDHPFDIDAFLVQARRRLRRRRSRRAAAAAAVVAGLCLVGVLLVPGHRAGAGTVGPLVGPAATGGGRDPMTVDVTFGWLPAQLVGVDYQVQPAPGFAPHVMVGAHTPATGGALPKAGANLSTQAWDWNATGGLNGRISSTPEIGLVNGHQARAQITTGPQALSREIRVLFASVAGRTAELETRGLSLEDTLRIARAVRFGTTALPLQVQVTGVDAPASRAGVVYRTLRGKWVATLLDLAVRDHHNYEAFIAVTPTGQPLDGTWWGRSATVSSGGVTVELGLSDTVAGESATSPDVTLADLYPEDGGVVPDTVRAALNDPGDYGDPASFLASHVRVLPDPSWWTLQVLER